MPMTVDLNHTLEHAKIKKLVDLGPIDVLRQLVHDGQLVRLMTNLLAYSKYVCLFHY